jgi:hypothetical protein
MKRIKKLDKQSHAIFAENLWETKKNIEIGIIQCSQIYGFNDKAVLKFKRALTNIEDIRSLMDNRFFSEHPDSDSRESPYYGDPGKSHGAKAITEAQI